MRVRLKTGDLRDNSERHQIDKNRLVRQGILDSQFSASIVQWTSPGRLIPIYAIGVVGAFLQIAGAQWDVSAHILGIVETFFTPAHTVLYIGIAMVAVASLSGLVLRSRSAAEQTIPPVLLKGLGIGLVGSAFQVIAAPIDFWWHSTYGFDPFLFTPAHSLLIVGMIIGGAGMVIGSVRIFRAQRAGLQVPGTPRMAKLVPGIVILGLAALWLQLNFFGYWITDITGMAYTFGYCTIADFRAFQCPLVDSSGLASLVSFLLASGIFATAGTIIFWTTKSLFHRRGIITIIALVMAAVYSFAVLAFPAYELSFSNPPGSWYLANTSPDQGTRLAFFIPIYLLSVIPVIVFDLLTKISMRRGIVLGLSALIGPFMALVDGRFTLGVSESTLDMAGIAILLFPLIVGGLGGWALLNRMTHEIFPKISASDLMRSERQDIRKRLK